MITSSKPLYEFYRDYLEWVENGAPAHKIFSRRDGLCCNLYDYCATFGFYPGKISVEMHRQFEKAGLNDLLPFNLLNEGLNPPFSAEQKNKACHLNERRIQWVRDRLEDCEWLRNPITLECK